MSDDQFTRLYSYMTDRFDSVDSALSNKASSAELQKTHSLLDAISKRSEIHDDERVVMGHQLERLDKWVHELARKIGYSLSR